MAKNDNNNNDDTLYHDVVHDAAEAKNVVAEVARALGQAVAHRGKTPAAAASQSFGMFAPSRDNSADLKHDFEGAQTAVVLLTQICNSLAESNVSEVNRNASSAEVSLSI